MRRVPNLTICLSLLSLICGCSSLNPKSFDPTRFWRLNRGENYMNDDGYYSVPVADPSAAKSPQPSTLSDTP